MPVIRILLLAAGLGLAACASGSGSSPMKWSASAWNGLAAQTIGTENYSFFAAPLDGEGFKLKLTLATDGAFRIQEGEDTFPEELRIAAEQAAPEGCRLDTIALSADGSAEASYDCET